MGRPGPKKVHPYSVELKLTAVKLSGMPGVQVQTVAAAGQRERSANLVTGLAELKGVS